MTKYYRYVILIAILVNIVSGFVSYMLIKFPESSLVSVLDPEAGLYNVSYVLIILLPIIFFLTLFSYSFIIAGSLLIILGIACLFQKIESRQVFHIYLLIYTLTIIIQIIWFTLNKDNLREVINFADYLPYIGYVVELIASILVIINIFKTDKSKKRSLINII